MARVICTIPFLPKNVNGVNFTVDRGQAISDEVSDEVAANFAKIPGYAIAGAAAPTAPKGAKAPAATATTESGDTGSKAKE